MLDILAAHSHLLSEKKSLISTWVVPKTGHHRLVHPGE
jgi:hypothetical protein